jgi:putative ABC transport system permease protein
LLVIVSNNNMIRNFLKLTLRNLLKQRFSSFVNIVGLAIGFACFIVIGLYVYDESRYDLFHEKGERIYRLHSNTFNPNRVMTNLPALLYEPLLEGLPEAEAVTRVLGFYGGGSVAYGDEKISTDRGVVFVDPCFFDIFDFPLQRGEVESFLADPHNILITSKIAEKYFGTEDPIGKTLRYKGRLDMVVTGILENIPKHSHLHFDIVGNFELRRQINPFIFETWGNYSSEFYVLLRPDADPALADDKILTLFGNARNIDYTERDAFIRLQPLYDIYLGSGNIETLMIVESGSPSTVAIFSVSALLILLLACFNYVNLATAKSTIRAREVGMRKVLGASRGKLIRYFLAESFLVALLAMLLGIGLVELSFPLFSDITGKSLDFSLVDLRLFIPALAVLLILVTLVSGVYPAFVMSGYQPVQVLKGSALMVSRQLKSGLGFGLRFRQLLIVLQFAISIALVSGSLILYSQTKYALVNSGFEREALLVIQNHWGQEMINRYTRMRTDLLQYPFVKGVSAGLHVPGEQIGNQGYLRQPDQMTEEAQPIVFATVDFGYFEVLGAKMAEGRDFDVRLARDSSEVVILNQSAVRLLGLTEPVGTQLTGFWDDTPQKRVIGVVEDIHFQSVHRAVQPTAFIICIPCQKYPNASRNVMVRLHTASFNEPIRAIHETWDAHGSGNHLEYFFMDIHYESLYRKELQAATAARLFTILAVIIACMGLLGTTVYIMEARKKEFGIRKVLGASLGRIVRMVSLEFALLILLSNLIAWPLTWYFMSRWLDNFVYRIDLNVWYFATAGIVGLAIALVAVNSLGIHQARENPVESLKYE